MPKYSVEVLYSIPRHKEFIVDAANEREAHHIVGDMIGNEDTSSWDDLDPDVVIDVQQIETEDD